MDSVSSVFPLPGEPEVMQLFPQISSQMRGMLSNIYLAGRKILPEPEQLSPEKRKWLGVFNQYYFRMLRLVNNMSAASYLTGQRTFRMEACEMVSMIRTLCELSANLAEYGEVKLVFECPLSSHISLVDTNAVRLLACHLISNALKFTPAGGTVTVRLNVKQEHLILSVADTGCGITPECFSTLFDGYLHPEPGTMPLYGLGIGLALCRCVAHAHKGKIVAESRSGQGSCFSFIMPDSQPKEYEGMLHESPANELYGGFSPVMLYLADALAPETFLYFDD